MRTDATNAASRRRPGPKKWWISLSISLATVAGFVLIFFLFARGPDRIERADLDSPTELPAPERVAGADAADAGDSGASGPAEDAAPAEEDLGPPLLRGRVTGEGAPIAGASVRLYAAKVVQRALERLEEIMPQGEMPDIDGLIASVRDELEKLRAAGVEARTAEDGIYEFRRIDEGGYVVLTLADGWLFRYGDVVSIQTGRTETLDIDLSLGGVIAGRVLTTDGYGVGGVTVIAEFRVAGAPGVGKLVRRLLRYVDGEFLKGPFETRSDQDGAFEVRGLPPGTYDLVALRADGLETRLPGVETGSSQAVIILGEGATVSGLLADAAGVPASDVRVRVDSEDQLIQLPLPAAGFNKLANTIGRLVEDTSRSVLSGTKGEFLVGPLAPGRYRLSIEEPGLVPLERTFEVDWGSHENMGLLRIDRGAGISGVVRSSDGLPIEGAKVIGFPENAGFLTIGNAISDVLTERLVAATDSSGAFRLRGVPKGQYRLSARARGFAAGTLAAVSTGGEPVTFLLEPGVRISGLVVDAATGEPVPDARVRANESRGRSDADGRFVLDGVAPIDRSGNPFAPPPARPAEAETTVGIRAAAPGYLDGRGTVDLAKGDDEVRIELARAPEIVGTVLDPDGQPAPGALVRLTPWIPAEVPGAFDFLRKGAIFLAVGVSDLEGRFRLAGFPGGNQGMSYQVMADHFQFARGLSDPFQLEGTVGEDGKEVGVRFTAPGGRASGRRPGGRAPEAQAPGGQVPGGQAPGGQATGGQAPGGQAPGGQATGGGEDGATPKGPAGSEVVVRLERASHIRGIVTDGSAPVGGATIRLVEVGSEEGQDATQAMIFGMLGLPKGGDLAYTGREGRFSYESLRPGEYTLQADVVGFIESPPQQVTLAPGEDVDLVLTVDPGGEIRGTVVDLQAFAVPGAKVRLLRAPEGDDRRGREMLEAQRFLGGAYKATQSEEDGSFALTGLPYGSYSLIVEKEGYRKAEVGGLSVGGSDVRVVLEAAAALAGRVLDQATGRPVTQFQVRVRKLGAEADAGDAGARMRAFVEGAAQVDDAEGRFRRGGLEAGESEVEVTAGGYSPARVPVILIAGQEIQQTFFLATAGRIAGSVVELETGRPIAGARVSLSPSALGAAGGSEDSSSEASSGDAAARRKERREAMQKARQARRDETPEEGDTRAFGEHMSSQFGEGIRGTTRDDGTFVLEGVPLGPQRILVTHDRYAPGIRDGIQVAPGEEVPLSIGLRAGYSLSGRLRTDRGEGLPGRTVFVRGLGEENAHVQKTAPTAGDGGFRFDGLSEGGYRLVVMTSPGATPTTIQLDLTESRSDVEIIATAE